MRRERLTIQTSSAAETESLGLALATQLPIGTVVALRGELATGKTCLVRGMASHFAKDDDVTSPTFTIVNEYGNSQRLYHLDLYRLDIEEVIDLGYEDLFEPDGVSVIEWAERAEGLFPSKRVDIFLEHAGHDCRKLIIEDHGVMPEGWFDVLKRALNHL